MAAGYPAAQFWFNVVQFVFTGLVALYVRKVSKHKATENRFKKIEETIAGVPTRESCARHEERTAATERHTLRIQAELDHLPTQKQMNELNKSIAALSSELKNTQGRLEGINRAVDLINEFLINQGSGAKS